MAHGRPLRIGFKTRQVNVDWPTLLATWELADSLEIFDSGWLFDHFAATVQPEGFGSHEGWTLAAALASRTRRIRLGHLVLGNTHRHPALLAKMATTLDHIATGRFVLGLGAGWHEAEHQMFGWPLPPIGKRMAMLDSSVRVLKSLWTAPGPWTYSRAGYALTDAVLEPRPFTPGGPPIWLGTQGKLRGLRIVAELADGWNTNTWLDDNFVGQFRELRDTLRRHCEDVGRDFSEIEISAQVFVPGRNPADVVSQAVALAREGVHLLVFLIEARRGPAELQRLAAEIVEPTLGLVS